MPSDPNPQLIFADAVGPWHNWFAWRPVKTYDQRTAWLRTIRRRCMQTHYYLSFGGMQQFWQYHMEGR